MSTQTSTSASSVPASWQPDPWGRHQHRWHDGQGWTAHVSDDGTQASDPPGAAGAASPGPNLPAAVAGPVGPAVQASSLTLSPPTSTSVLAADSPLRPPTPSLAPASVVHAQFGVPTLPMVSAPVRNEVPIASTAPIMVQPAALEDPVDEDETSLERITAVLLKVLWLPLCGIWLAALYALVGVLQCVGVITIPLGIQSLKIASYVIWPFGRSVSKRQSLSGLQTVGAVWWFISTGIFATAVHVVVGVALCVTIVGIPVGLATFRLIPLVVAPFGKIVGPSSQTRTPIIAM